MQECLCTNIEKKAKKHLEEAGAKKGELRPILHYLYGIYG